MSKLRRELLWLIGAIPTAILYFRGVTLTIKQGTESFGMVMTDYVALIVFWAITVALIAWLISYIYRWVYQKVTGKKLDIASSEVGNKSTDYMSSITNMNPEHTDHFFEGASKLNPEQILALFWGKKGEQKDGEGNKEAK